MDREEFLEAAGIATGRALEIARLKYLLGLEADVDYNAGKAVGFTDEGAVLVTHERDPYEDYYSVGTFVVPWVEIESPGYERTVADLNARLEDKRRSVEEAEVERKRALLARLKEELGE